MNDTKEETISPRQQQARWLYDELGMSMKEVAEAMGVSRQRVWELIKTAERKQERRSL